MKKQLTWSEFVAVQDCISNTDQIFEQVKSLPVPITIKGVAVPENLNGITYGQFISLSQAGENFFVDAPRIILGVDVADVRCDHVLAFGRWASEELARIGQLFASTTIEPSAEEKEAGVSELNVGIFGTIDWFAQRMHISHAEVENISWLVIYKCLDIEARRVKFNRRLRDIQARKAKQKK